MKREEAARLAELEADARFNRQRLDLYRAKAYSGRPTSDRRARELSRAAQASQARLADAQRTSRSRPDSTS